MSQSHDGAASAPWRPWRPGIDRGPPAGSEPRAKSFERKKYRPIRVECLERRSPLRFFFTGGVEYDGDIDLAVITRFIEDFRIFVHRLGVSPLWGQGVELKFRKLGRHRADGLYYPDCRVLVMDLRSTRSFAHEFGHLVDFLARRTSASGFNTPLSSSLEEFVPFHEVLLQRMRRDGRDDPRLSRGRGRCSWRYFTSAPECFARAFEQWAADILPPPSSLVGTSARYRSDVLFFRKPPEGLAELFMSLLVAGPQR